MYIEILKDKINTRTAHYQYSYTNGVTTSGSLLRTGTTRKLQQVPLELCDEGSQTGLKRNIVNTMVMFADDILVYVNNVQMENVVGYLCMGQDYTLKERTSTT